MAGSTLRRVRDIVRAEIDDVLTRIEDPRKMVNQMVRDMEDAFEEAVVEVSRAVAGQRILERRMADSRKESEALAQQAEEAVARGDDGSAKRLLERKMNVDGVWTALDRAHSEAVTTAERLKAQLSDLKTKLDEARSRGGSVAMRKAMASRRAESDIEPRLKTEPFADFDRYCRDVEREEIVAEVYRDIVGAPKDELDRQARDRRVAEELARLKQRASGSTEG